MNIRKDLDLNFREVDEIKEKLKPYYKLPIPQELIEHGKSHPEAKGLLHSINIIAAPQVLITVNMIKKLHTMLLAPDARASKLNKAGKMVEISASPGEFRKSAMGLAHNNETENNSVIAAENIAKELDVLCNLVNSESLEHPIIRATYVFLFFLVIHPFRDGNGRMARMLINIVLVKHQYPPITFEDLHIPKVYEDYRVKLKEGLDGNLAAFAELVLGKTLLREKEMLRTLERILLGTLN